MPHPDFDKTVVIDGVSIHVTAPDGVLPEGTELEDVYKRQAGLILIRTRTYNLIDTIIVRIMVVLGKAQISLVELNRQILRPFAGNPLIPQINFHLAVPGYLQHVLLAADVKVRELAAVSEQAEDVYKRQTFGT